jgi:hypothetical protein
MTTEQLTQFYGSFNSIDTLIEDFKIRLSTVGSYSPREMFVIHSLVHVARIQLHNPFVVEMDVSRLRVLDSARLIVASLVQVQVNEFVYIDPIMGVSGFWCVFDPPNSECAPQTLLMATCQVFVAELGRSKRLRPSSSSVSPEERSLISAIETVLAVMTLFGSDCRLMRACSLCDVEFFSTEPFAIESQLIAMRRLYQEL